MRAMGVGLRKPKDTRLGVDFAGTVEAVGKNVTQFKPGDEVSAEEGERSLNIYVHAQPGSSVETFQCEFRGSSFGKHRGDHRIAGATR